MKKRILWSNPNCIYIIVDNDPRRYYVTGNDRRGLYRVTSNTGERVEIVPEDDPQAQFYKLSTPTIRKRLYAIIDAEEEYI